MILIPSKISKYLRAVESVMDSCSGDHVLLSGDFNLPCIDWVTGEAVFVKKGSAEVQASAADLVQHLLFYNLKQYNTLLNSHKKR